MRVTVRPPTQVPSSLALTRFQGEPLERHPLWKKVSAAERKLLQSYLRRGSLDEASSVISVPRGSRGAIFVLGLGKRSAWNQRKFELAIRRSVVAARAEQVRELGVALVPFLPPNLTLERASQLAAENAGMAQYEFGRYRAEHKPKSSVNLVLITPAADKRLAARGAAVGLVVGEQTAEARDLGNVPGGEMTPRSLAEAAVAAGKRHGFKVEVLGQKELVQLKAGAILGVARGSAEEPTFTIMRYQGASPKDAPYVFVGKGVTFDSGGLNLKPGKHMNDMHLDMVGGAAVIAALGAAARLKLPVNIVGLVPAVENMPGSAGYRPGDILTSLSDKTIEVLNTDAEGRIILADALTYAERFKPRLVIDLATLTGACMVALGLTRAGLMSPDAVLASYLQGVGARAGEELWPLPLSEDDEDEVRGTFADVQNEGKSSPYGGAIHGALFLWQFAKAFPWAHLDIAGPMKLVDGQLMGKGASGFGVRFLVELVRSGYPGALAVARLPRTS